MKKYLEVIFFILKVTFLAFGGGNALFPAIRKYAVKKKKWITDNEFEKLMITTNMIPGPSVVESLSYISMRVLGPIKGAIACLIGIFPHILFSFGVFLLCQTYLPEEYLYVVNVSIMPVIIGVLLAFSFRFLKISQKELQAPLMIGLIILTISFSLFVPSPWNIPAFVMVGVIIIVFIYEMVKNKKKVGDK